MKFVNGEKIGQKTHFLDWKLNISHHCFKMTYNVMHLSGAERQEKKMVESRNMSNFLSSNSADSEKEMCVWQIISVCDSLSVCQISSAHAKQFFI